MPNTKGVRVANMTPDNFNATVRSLESDMPPPDAIGFNIGLKIADLGETNYSAFLDQLDPLCNEFEVGVTLNVGLKVGDVADMDYPNYYRTLTELCETYGIPHVGRRVGQVFGEYGIASRRRASRRRRW